MDASMNTGEDVSCGSKRKMMEESTASGGGSTVRNSKKERKRSDNVRREFSTGTCESTTRCPFIEEIADDSEEKSPMLNATDEVVSSASSMHRTMEKSKEFTNTTTSSESSEFEASSDQDNDDPKDKDYRVNESSNSSQSDDIRGDFDDEESENDDEKQENNEKGQKESNGGLVPKLAIEGEKHNKGRAYLLRPRLLSKSKKKKLHQINLNHGTRSSPILLSDDEESKSSSKKDCKVDELVQNVVQKNVVRKNRNTQKKILDDSELLKFDVDSIINVDDHDKLTPSEEKKQVPVKETPPLIFQFEDKEPLSPEKEEWEKEIEHLFGEMDMCILESHISSLSSHISS